MRHMWQTQAELQAAKISNSAEAVQTAQKDYAKLRREALWSAASPGCLACAWRWLTLPRSL